MTGLERLISIALDRPLTLSRYGSGCTSKSLWIRPFQWRNSSSIPITILRLVPCEILVFLRESSLSKSQKGWGVKRYFRDSGRNCGENSMLCLEFLNASISQFKLDQDLIQIVATVS